MTLEEAKQAIDELKAQGETPESMLATFYLMFQEDEIDVDELSDLCELIGYELTDEFRKMSPEDQKTKGWEETDEAEEDLTKEEIEDAKEFDKDEAKAKKADADSDDEEDEKEKARKLFGL